jgi:DnaJ-class molecular chaperone
LSNQQLNNPKKGDIKMPHPELKGDPCPECKGSGKIKRNMGHEEAFNFEDDCPKCNGTGVINSPNACKECKGKGKVIKRYRNLPMEVTCNNCKGSCVEP